MSRFKKPYAILENGETKFVLWDGTKTKSVYDFCEFNNELGGFIILNKEGKQVEFMDCVGNFTKKPTNFAMEFNRYINTTGRGIKYGSPYTVSYTTLLDFPSKYLISKKIRKIIKNEENYKIKDARKNHYFNSLLEYLAYRIYVFETIKKKFNKADSFNKNLNIKGKSEDLYYEI